MPVYFQMFVPYKAYVIQFGFFVVGVLYLLPSVSKRMWPLAVGGAYPLGATMAGLIQWLAFVFNVNYWAVPFWICTSLVVTIRALIVLYKNARYKEVSNVIIDNRKRTAHFGRPWLQCLGVAILIGATFVGFLISQSSDVGDSDPRWQIAYRAKIIANNAGYDTPHFHTPNVVHVNPKYPLAFSSVTAITMRLAGDTLSATVLRAVSFGFFLSFLLLLAAYGICFSNIAGAVVAGLVVMCAPKFWALGIDENYADLPLGVLALTFVLLVVTEPKKLGKLPLFVIGVGMVGFKTEGIILLASLGLIVAQHIYTQYGHRRTLVFACSILTCVLAGLVIHAIALMQIPRNIAMENVQVSDAGIIKFFSNIGRFPMIFKSFFIVHSFRFKEIGLVVPIIILGSFLARGPFRTISIFGGLLYLWLMMIPFLFSSWEPVSVHLQITVPRILWHVIPLFALVIAEGIGCFNSLSVLHSEEDNESSNICQ